MACNLRRTARERALQLLFLLDCNPPRSLDAAIDDFWRQQQLLNREENGLAGPTEESVRAFANRLARGVWRSREEIDDKIAGHLQNWSLGRLGTVERNVLRIAFYELFFEQDVPPVVCINEAVDLAKFYSTTGSGRFVNGILDQASKEVPRDRRQNPLRRPENIPSRANPTPAAPEDIE